jgi:tetratricopeptide (TPR) repeat protein
MTPRSFLLVSVCSAFLAASAAATGAHAATAESKLVSQAYKALQVGDAEEAVRGYTKAIESRTLEPELLANALLNRGLAYQRLNEHEFAVDDYSAAMRIDAMTGKLRALALYNRGLSYQRLQRNALAVEDFTSALFLDSQFSHAYYSRGTLLRDGGQHLFALADFDKALRFNYPDPARVYVAESITFEKLRRTNDARNALNKALAVNPNYEPAVQRLAVLDGKIQAPAAGADQLATAAVTPAKPRLPAAQQPDTAMLSEGSASPVPEVTAKLTKKRYADRVPEEAAAAKIVPASAAPNQAEKILAVETVPEMPAASDDPVTSEAPAAANAPAAAASSEEPAPPAEAQKITGWSVQLASAATEDAAWSTWKKMKARHKALKSMEPVVVKADLGSKGVFYRVRLVGFDSQSDASSECSRLKSRGVKCYISKAAS